MVEKIIETMSLGKKLLAEFELDNEWTFELTNTKVRMGECDFDTMTIGISHHFLEHNPMDEIEDTIRHEIAHALAGPRHGHDDRWRMMCLKVGAKPERCYDSNEVKSSAKHNYFMECPKCKRRWYRYRMRRSNFRSRCPECQVEVKIYKIRR